MRRVIALAAIIAAIASPALSATVEHWIIIRLDKGETVSVLSQAFVPISTVPYGDGAVAFTGNPGRYAVFVGPSGRVLVAEIPGLGPTPPGPPVPPPTPDPIDPTPGPTPNPVDPTPPPDLTDFPLEVWRQAIKIGDPDGAARIAANYAEVSRMKGDRDQLVAKLGDLNKALDLPKWNPFGVWIGKECNARGQTLPEIRQVYTEIAAGLRAVK